MFTSIKFLLIGIGIGILIAPEKGAVTRQKLLNKINRYEGDVSDDITKASEKAKEVTNETKNELEGLEQKVDENENVVS